jgi:hypothetical protein
MLLLKSQPIPRKVECLVKVHDRNISTSLLDGEFWAWSLDYYATIENEPVPNEARFDKMEDLAAHFQHDLVNVRVGGHLIEGMTAPIVIQRVLKRFAFCLYSVHAGELYDQERVTLDQMRSAWLIDEQCQRLGDSVMIIRDGSEFTLRFKRAIKKSGCVSGFRKGPVRYFNPLTAHGKVPTGEEGFWKQDLYDYQKEYRYLFETRHPADKPLVFQLGDLRDICEVIPFSRFNDSIDVAVGP